MQINVNLSANINDITENKTTLASGWVELDGVIRFPVHVRQYTDPQDGLGKFFVSYPQRKTEDGYTGIVYPSSAEARNEIDSRVLAEFNDIIVNRKWEEVPVEEARVTRFEPRGHSSVRLVGLATVKVSGVTINGIQVKEGQYGMMVQMPQYRDRNGEYRDLVYATNRVMQEAVSNAVTAAYNSPEGIFRREEKEAEPAAYEEFDEAASVSAKAGSDEAGMEQQERSETTADTSQNDGEADEAEKENPGQETEPDTARLMKGLAAALQNHDKISIEQILMELPLSENIRRRQIAEGREIRVWDYSLGTQTASLMFMDGYLSENGRLADPASADSNGSCVQQVAAAWTDSQDLSVLSDSILFYDNDNPDRIAENRSAAQGLVTLVTGEKFVSIVPESPEVSPKKETAAETARLRAPTTLRQPRK